MATRRTPDRTRKPTPAAPAAPAKSAQPPAAAAPAAETKGAKATSTMPTSQADATSPAATKPAPARRAAKPKSAKGGTTAAASQVSEETRRAMIAQSAYLRAERRGFAPGGEVDDWCEAEREVDALLNAKTGGGPQ